MQSFTFGSDEGMAALVKAQEENEPKYPMELNPTDFATVAYALRHYTLDHPSGPGDDMLDNAWSLLSGIAETLGVEFI